LVRDWKQGERDFNHKQTLMHANELKEFRSAWFPFLVGKFVSKNKIRLAIMLCYLRDSRLKFREWLDREQAPDC
jgi:hypothetical protein